MIKFVLLLLLSLAATSQATAAIKWNNSSGSASSVEGGIDIGKINKIINEDGLGAMGEAKIHSRTNPKNGEQITTSDFSFLNEKSIKFQVAEGQCFDEDCKTDRERAEITFPKKDMKNQEIWFRVAFFIPKETQVMWPMRWSIWQIKADVPSIKEDWKEEGCRTEKNLVLAMINVKKSGVSLTRHGDLFCEHRDFPLASHYHKETFGKWHDVIINIKFSANSEEGFMKAYLNGKRRVNFKGPMYDNEISKINVRTGIYNTFIKERSDRGTRQMHVDALGMGESCEDIADKKTCDKLSPK